jgi:four helix bundle protein
MATSNYRNLVVWQKSRLLAKEIYRASMPFPRSEMFGLSQQMRKSAVSIICNIAEGQGRWSRADCRHFLFMARGSALELEAQIVIAEDLEYVAPAKAVELNDRTLEIVRMLNGMIRHFERNG